MKTNLNIVSNNNNNSDEEKDSYTSLLQRDSEELEARDFKESVHVALISGNIKRCKSLIKDGDIKKFFSAEEYGLQFFFTKLVGGGKLPAAKEVYKIGININEFITGIGYPIQYTAQFGAIESMKFLLDLGADPTVKCSGNYNILHCVAFRKDTKMLEFILNNISGVDINQPTQDEGITPIMLAAKHGNLESTKILFENKADISVLDKEGRDLLYYVIENDDQYMIKELAKDKRVSNKSYATEKEFKNTPLCRALIKNNSEAIKLFLIKGENIAFNIFSEETPHRGILEINRNPKLDDELGFEVIIFIAVALAFDFIAAEKKISSVQLELIMGADMKFCHIYQMRYLKMLDKYGKAGKLLDIYDKLQNSFFPDRAKYLLIEAVEKEIKEFNDNMCDFIAAMDDLGPQVSINLLIELAEFNTHSKIKREEKSKTWPGYLQMLNKKLFWLIENFIAIADGDKFEKIGNFQAQENENNICDSKIIAFYEQEHTFCHKGKRLFFSDSVLKLMQKCLSGTANEKEVMDLNCYFYSANSLLLKKYLKKDISEYDLYKYKALENLNSNVLPHEIHKQIENLLACMDSKLPDDLNQFEYAESILLGAQ